LCETANLSFQNKNTPSIKKILGFLELIPAPFGKVETAISPKSGVRSNPPAFVEKRV